MSAAGAASGVDGARWAALSRLWLAEPDAAAIAAVSGLDGLETGACEPLAEAWTALFLMGVPPYAGVFLEPEPTLGGRRAEELERELARGGGAPPELAGLAAADHVGLLLGLLARTRAAERPAALARLGLDWAPVLCLAVEREPDTEGFYRALARHTREALLALAAGAPGPTDPALAPVRCLEDLAGLDEEGARRAVGARDIARHLVAPARSGLYLSRARLGRWARALGAPVPFGDRPQVALALLEAAGMVGRVGEMSELVAGEVRAWDAAYAASAARHPGFAPFAEPWRARCAGTLAVLAEMRRAAEVEPAP